ncbi:MAG: DUF1549 domain-containing protein [Verrucomicrobia bacterium]|nr:DUF1549 domain-containing protein [Verrucomicrobiota bacterium]
MKLCPSNRLVVARLVTTSILLAVPFVSLAGPELAAKAVNAPIPAKIDFSRDILPVISTKCFHCHGPDEKHREARLRLDVRDEAIKDRKGSIAIKPGDVKGSDLIARITTKDEDDVMPPPKEKKPLTTREIELFKKWIQQGAPYAEHWAFVKPKLTAVPRSGDTPVARTKGKVSGNKGDKSVASPGALRIFNPIDAFLAAKLKESKLKQAPPADRYTLIRRASLDLTGLPPTPAEVDAFVNDKSPNAFEKVVDRLLASSAYGERMARMWLDIARYADSAGYGSDPLRLNIWPYRDWVINAFNRNIPYDQFTLEQLAGDLLPDATEEQQVATAFHRNTMTNTEGGTDDEEFRVAAVKDRIAVTVQAWMGLTMGCAQCHTHKFDPITQREYYSMFAIFNQTEDSDKPTEEPTLSLPTPAEREKTKQFNTDIAALETKLKTSTPELTAEQSDWEKKVVTPVEWSVLDVVEFKGSGKQQWEKRDDGSIVIRAGDGQSAFYDVKARTALQNITAVRLELIPDAAFQGNGPGRAPNGNAVVSEFKLLASPAAGSVAKGRIVRVEIPGAARFLSLAEVEVFSGGKNVATKGKASQSSTGFEGEARLAIDGNTDGDYYKSKSVTHTQQEENPWWEVDLGADVSVERVVVWNRTDGGGGTRLANFRVQLLDAARKPVFTQMVKDSPTPSVALATSSATAVPLLHATADYSQSGFDVTKAIDGDTKTGWAIGGATGKAHAAVFELVKPLNAATLNSQPVPAAPAKGKKKAARNLAQQFAASLRAVPPHPGPLPRGEGESSSAAVPSGAAAFSSALLASETVRQSEPVLLAETRGASSPLPKGEGQGEGKAASDQNRGTISNEDGFVLTFQIQQSHGGDATLGRFRLLATSKPAPVAELPETVKSALAIETPERTAAQAKQVTDFFRPLSKTYAGLVKDLDAKKKELAAIKPVAVPVLKELAKDKQRETHILTKGNFLAPGDKVEPGFLKAFSALPKDTPLNRIGVARYLTSPDNPLTARVAVNRFWAQLFGIGLVETEEDFGTQGQPPSHPELLDWLAVTFSSPTSSPSTINSDNHQLGLNWDMKALVKLIVMSATYQQSSLASADAAARDPRNRLLSHYPRRRLDAEAVRDQALALSGLLSKKIGGPSVYPPQPDGLWRAAFNGQRAYPTSTGEDRYRRALYTFWRRTIPYPSMATFDAPSRENCTVRRLPTNTPLQAFVTLNDPAFVEMAQALGRRIVANGGATVSDRVRYGLNLALARPPSDEQVKALIELYEKELAHYRSDADAAKQMSTDPLGPLPAGLDAAEAAAWTVVGNVLLNLDGVLTKG